MSKFAERLEGLIDKVAVPWRIDRDSRSDMEWNNHIYGDDEMCVCFMAHDDTPENETGEANAAIMVLLANHAAAIAEIVSLFETLIDTCDGNYKELTDECRAALAKLEKEQS